MLTEKRNIADKFQKIYSRFFKKFFSRLFAIFRASQFKSMLVQVTTREHHPHNRTICYGLLDGRDPNLSCGDRP